MNMQGGRLLAKILVVDDSEAEVLLLAGLLSDMEVQSAGDGFGGSEAHY